MLDIGFQNLSRCWPPGSRSGWWCWTPRSTPTRAARPAPPGSPGRWRTCPRTGRRSTASRRSGRTGAHRPGAPRRLRAPVLAGHRSPPDRRSDQAGSTPAAGGLQHLHAMPGGARPGGRVGAPRGQARPGDAGLPVHDVRSRRGPVRGRMRVAGRQSGHRRAVAHLRADVRGRRWQEQLLELPLTTADWAATEARFKKHFKKVSRRTWNEDMVPFHEFV